MPLLGLNCENALCAHLGHMITALIPLLLLCRELTSTLDRMEDILSRQRYLVGSVLTEADIRAFVTLIRYDEVYVVYFKTNTKLIREYANIREYVKDIYQVNFMHK